MSHHSCLGLHALLHSLHQGLVCSLHGLSQGGPYGRDKPTNLHGQATMALSTSPAITCEINPRHRVFSKRTLAPAMLVCPELLVLLPPPALNDIIMSPPLPLPKTIVIAESGHCLGKGHVCEHTHNV